VTTATTDPAWLDSARRIVARHQFEVLDPITGESVEYVWVLNPEGWEPVEEIKPKRGNGILLDAFTASYMVQVHDALGDVQRERFRSMTFEQAANITIKLMEKRS
jgi:hypothetical protein